MRISASATGANAADVAAKLAPQLKYVALSAEAVEAKVAERLAAAPGEPVNKGELARAPNPHEAAIAGVVNQLLGFVQVPADKRLRALVLIDGSMAKIDIDLIAKEF
jgi:hypothetical protein